MTTPTETTTNAKSVPMLNEFGQRRQRDQAGHHGHDPPIRIGRR